MLRCLLACRLLRAQTGLRRRQRRLQAALQVLALRVKRKASLERLDRLLVLARRHTSVALGKPTLSRLASSVPCSLRRLCRLQPSAQRRRQIVVVRALNRHSRSEASDRRLPVLSRHSRLALLKLRSSSRVSFSDSPHALCPMHTRHVA